MNIFKGMRRLSLVIGIVTAGYATESAWSNHTYLQLGYRVTDGGKELVHSLDCPSLNDGVHRQLYRTVEGNQFEARICFPGIRTGPREYQIRIQQTDGGQRTFRTDTPEAEHAMRNYVAEQFRLTPSDLAYADQAYHAQRYRERQDQLQDIALLLIAYFGLVAALGWVVRGFLNVPYCSDQRVIRDKGGQMRGADVADQRHPPQEGEIGT